MIMAFTSFGTISRLALVVVLIVGEAAAVVLPRDSIVTQHNSPDISRVARAAGTCANGEHLLVQGRKLGSNAYDSSKPPVCATHNTLAAVRCCSPTLPYSSGGWKQVSSCQGLYVASDDFGADPKFDGCHKSETYDQAKALCVDAGADLCTLQQHEAGCGSGCYINKEYIWSSSTTDGSGPPSPTPAPTTAAPTASTTPPPPTAQPDILSITGEQTMGEFKQYHKVTIDLQGVQADESDSTNPFLDYRFDVTFTLGTDSPIVVPGYFAADGNAAHTSATGGNIWRVHFVPPTTGQWTLTTSFTQGTDVSALGGGDAVDGLDGLVATFSVTETDKTGRDFSGKGSLRYVGERYPKFDNGEYFIKAGSDSPENLLGYYEFDGTIDKGGIGVPGYKDKLHHYDPHLNDWNTGDPTWGSENKGKRIIGAINYLASTGANTFAFLTYNWGGDGRDVWPFVIGNQKTVYDCSKLDQWEILFEHADKLGMHMNFKTQERENDNGQHAFDNGNLGVSRKLYYRELIARFSHHRAVTWNLGEETSQTISQIKDMAAEFKKVDPYEHNVVIHTYPNELEQYYAPLLGDQSELTGASIQSDHTTVHRDVVTWVTRSEAVGQPWIVSNDEQGFYKHGIYPDDSYPAGADPSTWVANVLWGTFLGGGAGVEVYFGYDFHNNDLNMETFRSRKNWWGYSDNILKYFEDVPYWTMHSADNLITGGTYCFAAPGSMYIIYHKNSVGSSTKVDLSGHATTFSVKWYDPMTGGDERTGSKTTVQGGGNVNYGTPPGNGNKHWVARLYLSGPTPEPTAAPPTANPTTAEPTTSAPTPTPTTSQPSPSPTTPAPTTPAPTPSPTTTTPTPSPTTPSPTIASTCHIVLAGGPEKLSVAPIECADDDEPHHVRCCADGANPYPEGLWVYKSKCNLYTASQGMEEGGGCLDPMSWGEADAYCKEVNGRLCSKEEILNDCAGGTGCALNKEQIWSSDTDAPPPITTPAPTGNYIFTKLGDGCCRGVDEAIPRETYTLFSSIDEESACERKCAESPECTGYELSNAEGCEVHTVQITHVAVLANCVCYTRSAAGPTPEPTTPPPTTPQPTPQPTTPQPTPQPTTNQPTPPPTTAAPSPQPLCNQVSGGAFKHRNTKPAKCVDPNDDYHFRCCVKTDMDQNPYPQGEWKQTSKDGCNNIWAGAYRLSAAQGTSCPGKKNFAEAAAYCSDAGARLCTVAEYVGDCTIETGCSIGSKYLWSSS
eukprot:m.244303 g.244303  ORF g.244303 m.244303 type:complete len:1235 (+) comp33825_c0_seq3:192-3896(+)